MPELDQEGIDAFIVARFAEWAGDLAYSRDLYSQFGHEKQYSQFPEKFDGPTDVIMFVSALRADRLGEPTSKRILPHKATAFAVDRDDTSPIAIEPIQLQPTYNLRAVVHRIGVRDFEMRGYLSNLKYEPELYAKAKELGASPTMRGELITEADPEPAYVSPGGEWVIEGVLFQQVSLSDFGLIKSDGRWTKSKVPTDSDEVIAPFQRLLTSLDPPLQPIVQYAE